MTGVLRKLDRLGRVVIPKQMLDNFGIKHDDVVEISSDPDDFVIRIRPAKSRCVLCGSEARLLAVDCKHICESCAKKICALSLSGSEFEN